MATYQVKVVDPDDMSKFVKEFASPVYPRVGDTVVLPDGSKRRIGHVQNNIVPDEPVIVRVETD